jgi:hypothetical protein
MNEHEFDLGTVVLCAAVGSIIAGATLGASIASSYVEYSHSLWEAVSMVVSVAVGGAIFGLLFGGTVGIAVGLLVSRYVGTSIGHAALTGALTGTAFPLFFLVTGLLMGANGLAGLTGSFVLFAGLGAICGTLAHWLVVRRTVR